MSNDWLHELTDGDGQDPTRIERFMAGDVYVCHPWTIHCTPPNANRQPRFLRSPTLSHREYRPTSPQPRPCRPVRARWATSPSILMTDGDGTFDPAALLRVLDEHGVRSVLIGGIAAAVHGSPYVTTDVDVTPAADAPTLTKLSAALRQLGAKVRKERVPEVCRSNTTVPRYRCRRRRSGTS